ncbi:Protein PBDC1 [Lamellibrachia satsuma]|nr:Protein PBDC1 [Lamellibrachia satsuma]
MLLPKMDSLGGSEAAAVSAMLHAPAENLGNDPNIEMHWAMKAYQHAETYFSLITSVDTRELRLTKIDNELYEKFRKEFPDMDVSVINENELKSPEGKKEWHKFLMQFEGKVVEWNMGTLLRLNCKAGISDENTILVPKMQFLAIEVARNREVSGVASTVVPHGGRERAKLQQRPIANGGDITPFNMALSVTSSELEKDITDILKDADLSKLSSKKVRKSLEDLYNTDLTGRKKEIDSLVMKAISGCSTKSTGTGDSDEKKTDSKKEKSSPSPKKRLSSSSNDSYSDSNDSGGESSNEDRESEHSNSEIEEANYAEQSENMSPPKKKMKSTKKACVPNYSDNGLGDEELAKQLQQEEEDGGRRQTRGGGRKPVVKAARKGKKGSGDGDGAKPPKKTNNMYTRLCVLSAPLAEVMGKEKMARSDVIKRMWAIIRERDLLDPKNKQYMLVDDELYKVFGRKRVRTFGMMKFLKNHVFTPEYLTDAHNGVMSRIVRTPFRECLITAVFIHWSPAATPVDMEVAVGKD